MRRQLPPDVPRQPQADHVVHGGWLRMLHWLTAASILLLLASGLSIYNAAPFYPVTFPDWLTIGGGLSGALLWHFAAMWVLLVSLVAYLVVRIALRRGGPALLPLQPSSLVQDARLALTLRLQHCDGAYNSIQRLFYLGIAAVMLIAVLSGLAIWKPVQLGWLAASIGGYEWARRVHFWAMAGTCQRSADFPQKWAGKIPLWLGMR